jgi:hypothetical protein
MKMWTKTQKENAISLLCVFCIALALAMLLCCPAHAQNTTPIVSPNGLDWPLQNPPGRVISVSITRMGNPGLSTYYYWIVTNALVGQGPLAGPFTLTQAPAVFAVSYALASGTYTSGITATGSVGETCKLSSFNHGSTATATVALTGHNAIAGGTALVFTSFGSGATAASTTAAVSNGTAVCTGTAVVSTVLGHNYSTGASLNWAPVNGATSYDCLRTSTGAPPSGTGNYAVTTGIASTNCTDTGQALASYTVSPTDTGALRKRVQNQSTGDDTSCLAIDGVCIDTGVPSSFFYQIDQDAGAPLPQEAVNNFASGFNLADNPGNHSTDISPAPLGPATLGAVKGTGGSVNCAPGYTLSGFTVAGEEICIASGPVTMCPPIVQTDLTGVNAFGVVYHNTDTTTRWVAISVDTQTTGGITQAFSDSSPAPSTAVSNIFFGTVGTQVPLGTFAVPAGNYYEVTNNGNGTIVSWIEWQGDCIGSGGAAAPPLYALQYNDPLGTFAGNAGYTYNPTPGAGYTDVTLTTEDPSGEDYPLFVYSLGTAVQIISTDTNGLNYASGIETTADEIDANGRRADAAGGQLEGVLDEGSTNATGDTVEGGLLIAYDDAAGGQAASITGEILSTVDGSADGISENNTGLLVYLGGGLAEANAYAIDLPTMNIPVPPSGNAAALHIGDQTLSGDANALAMLIDGGISVFGGPVVISSLTPGTATVCPNGAGGELVNDGSCTGGGGGSAAPPLYALQYNDPLGVLAGNAGLTYNPASGEENPEVVLTANATDAPMTINSPGWAVSINSEDTDAATSNFDGGPIALNIYTVESDSTGSAAVGVLGQYIQGQLAGTDVAGWEIGSETIIQNSSTGGQAQYLTGQTLLGSDVSTGGMSGDLTGSQIQLEASAQDANVKELHLLAPLITVPPAGEACSLCIDDPTTGGDANAFAVDILGGIMQTAGWVHISPSSPSSLYAPVQIDDTFTGDTPLQVNSAGTSSEFNSNDIDGASGGAHAVNINASEMDSTGSSVLVTGTYQMVALSGTNVGADIATGLVQNVDDESTGGTPGAMTGILLNISEEGLNASSTETLTGIDLGINASGVSVHTSETEIALEPFTASVSFPAAFASQIYSAGCDGDGNSPDCFDLNFAAGPSYFGGAVEVDNTLDGRGPVTLSTGATISLGTQYNTGVTLNQAAVSIAPLTATLPPAIQGMFYCVGNDNNGTGPNTGAITLQTSGAGQYIELLGVYGASGGYLISGGAAGDYACVQAVDATHWRANVQAGSWTLD